MRDLIISPTISLGVITALLCTLWVQPARADKEKAPHTHVVSGDDGRCYAKSVPKTTDTTLGLQAGLTRTFRVRPDNDMLVDEYDWYAPEIYVKCSGVGAGMDSIRIALVRRGPWHRGAQLSDDHLALAFYVGGEERKTWSTAAIVATGADPDAAVSRSKSHYRVFSAIPGFTWREDAQAKGGGLWVFEAVTVDGRTLVFNPATGELIP